MPLLLYMLPAFLALTLPMATLVAVLLVCGRLAGDLEVAALKASGVSPLRLFRPFLAVGIVATLLIAWLTLMVGPWSSGAFQRQLFRILQSRASTDPPGAGRLQELRRVAHEIGDPVPRLPAAQGSRPEQPGQLGLPGIGPQLVIGLAVPPGLHLQGQAAPHRPRRGFLRRRAKGPDEVLGSLA